MKVPGKVVQTGFLRVVDVVTRAAGAGAPVLGERFLQLREQVGPRAEVAEVPIALLASSAITRRMCSRS